MSESSTYLPSGVAFPVTPLWFQINSERPPWFSHKTYVPCLTFIEAGTSRKSVSLIFLTFFLLWFSVLQQICSRQMMRPFVHTVHDECICLSGTTVFLSVSTKLDLAVFELLNLNNCLARLWCLLMFSVNSLSVSFTSYIYQGINV